MTYTKIFKEKRRTVNHLILISMTYQYNNINIILSFVSNKINFVVLLYGHELRIPYEVNYFIIKYLFTVPQQVHFLWCVSQHTPQDGLPTSDLLDASGSYSYQISSI